jgi:hypothetical protein
MKLLLYCNMEAMMLLDMKLFGGGINNQNCRLLSVVYNMRRM